MRNNALLLGMMILVTSGVANARVQVDPSYAGRIEAACNKFPREALRHQAKACKCISVAHIQNANQEMNKVEAEKQLNWVISYYTSTNDEAKLDQLENGPLGFMLAIDTKIIEGCMEKTK